MTSRLSGSCAERPGQDPEIDGDAEEREAGDEQAGDGAGAEGDGEAGAERLRGGLRGADIGAHRDEHADEAGRAGEDGADGEAESGGRREQDTRRATKTTTPTIAIVVYWRVR